MNLLKILIFNDGCKYYINNKKVNSNDISFENLSKLDKIIVKVLYIQYNKEILYLSKCYQYHTDIFGLKIEKYRYSQTN